MPTKEDLKLDITELELAAELVEKEEEGAHKIQELHTTLSGLHLSDEEDSRYMHMLLWILTLALLYTMIFWSNTNCFSARDVENSVYKHV